LRRGASTIMASIADISLVASNDIAEPIPDVEVEICSVASTITIDDENDDQDGIDFLVSLSDELYTHRYIPEHEPASFAAISVNAISEATISEAAISEAAISETAISETAMSSTAMSSTAMSSTAMSSTAMSSTAMSSTTISSTEISSTDVNARDDKDDELAVSEIQDFTPQTKTTDELAVSEIQDFTPQTKTTAPKERPSIVRPTPQAMDASFALAASGWFWIRQNLEYDQIHGLELKLEGNFRSNSLVARWSRLRSHARKTKSKRRIMHLNVFPNEYTATSDDPLVFEDAAEDERCSSLHDRIYHLETALAGANENVSQLKSAVRDLKWNLTAAEAETTETAKSNEVLQSNNRMLRTENQEIARSNDILRARNQMLRDHHDNRDQPVAFGKKRMSELGSTQVKATKRAYRQKFVPAINAFGRNRELEVEKLILRDREGERVVVNAAPSYANDTLDATERQGFASEGCQPR